MEVVSPDKKEEMFQNFYISAQSKQELKWGFCDFRRPEQKAIEHAKIASVNAFPVTYKVHCECMTSLLISGQAGWAAQEGCGSSCQLQHSQGIQDMSYLPYCVLFTHPYSACSCGWVQHVQADHIPWMCSALLSCFHLGFTQWKLHRPLQNSLIYEKVGEKTPSRGAPAPLMKDRVNCYGSQSSREMTHLLTRPWPESQHHCLETRTTFSQKHNVLEEGNGLISLEVR